MSCGTVDNTGEVLRSRLIFSSPTSVLDDIGDTDDVNFSVGHRRFISAKETSSNLRRFGVGGSDGGIDGADGRFLGLQV
jgi:hypothetical protein